MRTIPIFDVFQERSFSMDKKTDIAKLIDFSICVFIFFLFFYFLMKGTDSGSNLFSNLYHNVAVIMLMFFVLWERKAKLINVWTIVFCVIYAAINIYVFMKGRGSYGYDFRNLLLSRNALFGLFIICAIDMIRTKKFARIKFSSPATVMLILAFIGFIILNPTSAIIFICPYIVWFTLPIEKKRWKKIVLYITVSLSILFVWIISYSLVMFPDSYVNERYSGCYQYLGSLSGLSAVCLLFLLGTLLYYRRSILKSKLNVVIILALALFIVLTAGVIAVTMQKILILGLFPAILIGLLYYNNKGKIVKSIIITTSVALALIALVCVVKYLSNPSTYQYLEENKEGSHFITYLGITSKKIIRGSNEKMYPYSVFEGGTYLNILDSMAGGRISVFVHGLKQIQLKPTNVMIDLPGDITYAPHNNYLQWLLGNGAIVGLIYNLWFVTYLISALVLYLKGRKELVITVMWSIVSAIVFIAEAKGWTGLYITLLLVLQYPLMVNFSDEKKKQDNSSRVDSNS